MTRQPWARFLGIGFTLMLACMPFGYPWIQIAFQLVTGASFICVLRVLFNERPRQRLLWSSIASTLFVFFVSYGGRLLVGSWWPKSSWHPTPADWLDLVAVIMTIIIANSMFKIRSNHRDPTTVLDSLILTSGLAGISWIAVILPYLHDERFSSSGRMLQVCAVALALGAVFAVSRLLMAPMTKSSSFHFLGAAASLGLASQIASVIEGTPEGRFCVLFGGFAMVTIGAFALKPPDQNQLGRLQTGERITWKRLSFMTIAVMTAPVILISHAVEGDIPRTEVIGLTFTWLVVTGLFVGRLAGLVQIRERVVANREVLRRAAAAFACATNQEEIEAAVMRFAAELLPINASGSQVVLLQRQHEGWEIVASSHEKPLCNGNNTIAISALKEFDTNPDADQGVVSMSPVFGQDRSDVSVITGVRFGNEHSRKGLLLVVSRKPLRSHEFDAIVSLVGDFGRATAAIALTEELHERNSAARFQALVRNSSDITVVTDTGGVISYVTPSVMQLLGHNPDELLGHNIAELVNAADAEVIRQLFSTTLEATKRQIIAEVHATSAEGIAKHFELTLTDYRSEPAIRGVVVNAHDVTERKRLEDDLRFRVLHDDLTGIPNRVLLAERARHALQSRRDRTTFAAVLVIDIDDFKTINDGLGHSAGDEVLRVVSFRLETSLRSGDSVARLGNDVFAVLLEEASSVEEVEVAAKRLRDMIELPLVFDTHEFKVNASIGIAIADANNIEAEEFIRNAEVALHCAKQTGKSGIRLFNSNMHRDVYDRLELKRDLAKALERDELFLLYQPLMALQTGHVCGFEALIRWRHPQRGIVSPISFIPLAEETGLVVPIGQWVVATAAKQLATWSHQHSDLSLRMNINLAPRQLEESHISDTLLAVVQDAHADPSKITFEVTESMDVEGIEITQLEALRNSGFGVAADDFGTGFATYASLRTLPFTEVKIDRSLVTDLDRDHSAFAQVRSIVEMGHALGLVITAEGIEESTQREALTEIGVDKGQGWLFGKPMSADDAIRRVLADLVHVQ